MIQFSKESFNMGWMKPFTNVYIACNLRYSAIINQCDIFRPKFSIRFEHNERFWKICTNEREIVICFFGIDFLEHFFSAEI